MRPLHLRSKPAVAATVLLAVGALVLSTPSGVDAQDTTRTVTYRDTNQAVPNPERGFHDGVSVADSTNDSTTSAAEMTAFHEEGIRLARMYVRLDDHRDTPIPEELLGELDRVFDNARTAGIKLIPRFAYNFGEGPDASAERIEAHLDQLAPVFDRHADVIAVMHAGFIGAWGEWHSSTSGLDNPADRARIRAALLDAVPEERMVQFRYPGDLIEFEPSVLTAADAFSGSDRARTAHKNDCVLANDHDAGTYLPAERGAELRAYTEAVTELTAMGGETCQVTLDQQRTDCATAVDEFARYHWDYLNLDFYGPTIDDWRGECFDEIEQRLGYRYRLIEATMETRGLAGERLDLQVEIANDGFGKLYNPRPIHVVLVEEETGAIRRLPYAVDARPVLPPGGAARLLDIDVVVPVDVPLGRHAVHLELPDGSEPLSSDPRYSVRFANGGTWDEDSGLNALRLNLNLTGVSDDPETPDPSPMPSPMPIPMPSPDPSPMPVPVPGGDGTGYWMVDDDGTVFAFGDAAAFPPVELGGDASVVDLDATPSGDGLWILDSTGTVHVLGDAVDHGDVGEDVSGRPTTLAPTPAGDGYWIFTTTGDVSTHGSAVDHGDVTDLPLNGPIIASAATVDGGGYWLLGTDGGVFALGNATFHGSMGGTPLNQPVNGLTPDPDGIGYWLVAGDGGVFAFDAEFLGSMGGTPLNAPVTGLIPYGGGYAMVASDGGAFVYSDEPFLGSLGGETLERPVVAMTARG